MISPQTTPKPVRAVTFDLDGTLWDATPVLARAEREVHDWLQRHHPRLGEAFSTEDLRALRHALAIRHPELRHNVTELRKVSIRIAAAQVGVDPDVSAQAFRVFMQHRNRVRLYDDVLPTLIRLRGRYTLCSLTNGNADVTEIGIAHMFHHSLSAVEAGIAKPDSELFRKVCELAGVTPDQTVHVGDEPETDIAGAAASGCRTVWINRSGASWTHDWRPDAEIHSLT
ncbi:MAG: HAD family hydrolase, partial [Acidiferrobacterales bacterium]